MWRLEDCLLWMGDLYNLIHRQKEMKTCLNVRLTFHLFEW